MGQYEQRRSASVSTISVKFLFAPNQQFPNKFARTLDLKYVSMIQNKIGNSLMSL